MEQKAGGQTENYLYFDPKAGLGGSKGLRLRRILKKQHVDHVEEKVLIGDAQVDAARGEEVSLQTLGTHPGSGLQMLLLLLTPSGRSKRFGTVNRYGSTRKNPKRSLFLGTLFFFW